MGARVSDGYDGSCAGGPIESVHDNWFEILRTERLDSREEAEALLAQLQSGATYTVTLDQSSEIQLADNLTDTFQPAAGGTFTDVPATHWAAGAVAFVSSQGLLQGISADTFAPGQPMTRAMLVTALWREAGSPVVNYAMDFDDVDEDQWYTEAVRWAIMIFVVSGINSRIALRIRASVLVSTALVESSRIRILGFLSSARAIHRRCFCPPDTLVPPCSIRESYLSGKLWIKSSA